MCFLAIQQTQSKQPYSPHSRILEHKNRWFLDEHGISHRNWIFIWSASQRRIK